MPQENYCPHRPLHQDGRGLGIALLQHQSLGRGTHEGLQVSLRRTPDQEGRTRHRGKQMREQESHRARYDWKSERVIMQPNRWRGRGLNEWKVDWMEG